MTIQELQKKVEELTQKLDAAEQAVKSAGDPAELDGLKKQIEELTAKVATAETERDTALEKAKMSDEEKDYEESLEDDEKKKAFRALAPDARKAEMKKRSDNDETVTIEGQTIRKSQVGDAPFAIFKAQADRITKQEKELAAERDLRKRAELTKRAQDEVPNLPGTDDEKIDVLKAVDGLDEKVRDTITKMLKAGNDSAKLAFEKVGHRGVNKGTDGDPAEFEKRVDEIASRDRISKNDAMGKARKEYPKAFEVYQASMN